ncbi:hypothetical protein IJT17_07690 [bacterium]|nr:hypothetical protein [bacterium]
MKTITRHSLTLLLLCAILLGGFAVPASADSNVDAIKQYITSHYSSRYEGPSYVERDLLQEGYGLNDVQKAIETCGFDWDARAVRAANYACQVVKGGASALGIAKILCSIGYTSQQTRYALEHCDIDWNYQAWRDAHTLVEKRGTNVSEEKVREFLLKLGYSEDQAKYGCTYRLHNSPGKE